MFLLNYNGNQTQRKQISNCRLCLLCTPSMSAVDFKDQYHVIDLLYGTINRINQREGPEFAIQLWQGTQTASKEISADTWTHTVFSIWHAVAERLRAPDSSSGVSDQQSEGSNPSLVSLWKTLYYVPVQVTGQEFLVGNQTGRPLSVILLSLNLGGL